MLDIMLELWLRYLRGALLVVIGYIIGRLGC